MAELTPIERVQRFFNREPVDKMPFFSGMGMVLLPAIKKLGYNFPSVHRNAERMARSAIESARMLIIEDDALLNEMLMLHFEDLGFAAYGAISCAEGLKQLGSAQPDLILLDQQLPDGTGLELLKTILGLRPDQAVIMMTGQHDLELAIEAIKAGARDFVHKPIDTQGLEQAVTKVLEQQRLTRERSTSSARATCAWLPMSSTSAAGWWISRPRF